MIVFHINVLASNVDDEQELILCGMYVFLSNPTNTCAWFCSTWDFQFDVCDWPLAQVLELYMEFASSALYAHGFALTAFYANEIWLKCNCTCYQPGVISFQNQQTQPSGAYHFQERLNLTSTHTGP